MLVLLVFAFFVIDCSKLIRKAQKTIDQSLECKTYDIVKDTVLIDKIKVSRLNVGDGITVVNYSKITGNIIIGCSKFINYGIITGRVISDEGLLVLKRGGEVNGKLFVKELQIQPGTALNGDAIIGIAFLEIERQAIEKGNFDEFEKLCESRSV